MSGREREVRELEELLLGGELRFTRQDAVRETGLSAEFTERLWRSFGFASPGDGVPAFTEGDLSALRRIKGLLDRGSLGDRTEELVLGQARAFGQTMARLAEWQSGLLRGAGLDSSVLNEQFLGHLEPLLLHAWRRQLAAAGARAMASMSEDGELASRPVAVGFADMVSFTAMSKELNEFELGRVVERFETTAADIVAAYGARLIKTLGDEVLYAADSAATGVQIGIDISEAVQRETEVPDVRVGMAFGPVLPLMGDIFGTTVNLASRLTSIARPGTLVADEGLAKELQGDSSYELVRIVRRPVRGLGIIQPYVVRRSTPR